MLAQLSRAAARTAPVVRRAPLRCLSAQPIDPSTSQRVTVTVAIRADEANHRDVNHLAAGMQPGQINPFFDPEAKLDKMLLKYAHDILDKTPEEVKLRTMGPSGA